MGQHRCKEKRRVATGERTGFCGRIDFYAVSINRGTILVSDDFFFYHSISVHHSRLEAQPSL